MRLYKRLCLPISLMACLAQASFAQCHRGSFDSATAVLGGGPPSTGQAAEHEVANRTVLLILKLSESGAVREATVLRGSCRW